MPLGKKNVYLLGPHPDCLSLVKPNQKPTQKDGKNTPPSVFHHSTNYDGTLCLSQADFDDAFWQAPPANYKVLSYDEALAQRKAWDKEYPDVGNS